MSTEQLQMILNAMQGLGLEGKQAFIWWLVLDKALPVVGWLLTLVGILYFSKAVIQHVSAQSYLSRIKDDLRIGCPGVVVEEEAVEVLRRVRQLVEAAKGRKDAV